MNESPEITVHMLERYLSGEVSDDEKNVIETAFVSRDEVIARLTFLRESLDGATKRQFSVPSLLSMIKSSAVAAVILFALPLLVLQGNKFYLKNSAKRSGTLPALTIYSRDSGTVRELRNYTTVASNDSLQIKYYAAGRKYGLIFSVDGNGVVSLHFPEDTTGGGGSARLEQGGVHMLPIIVVLDSAQLFERFYFLTSDDSINIPDIVEKCVRHFREGGAHVATRIRSLPTSILQTSIQFKKD